MLCCIINCIDKVFISNLDFIHLNFGDTFNGVAHNSQIYASILNKKCILICCLYGFARMRTVHNFLFRELKYKKYAVFFFAAILKTKTARTFSPDCSGILFRSEAEKKIQRKAGRAFQRSENLLAPYFNDFFAKEILKLIF